MTAEFDLFESDIVYRCPFKDSNQSLYLSLIWENKLRPSKWVTVQLGLYIFLALDKMVKEKGRKPEPIIPLIFYNGKEKWQPKTLHELFEQHPNFEQFKKFLPSFNFLFKNIVEIPTNELLSIEKAFLRSALIAMANRHDFDLIIQNFNAIFDLEEKYQAITIATYIFGISKKTKSEIAEIVNNLSREPSKEKIMSTLEMLLKEGEEIGIKKGEEIGIKKGKEIGIKEGEILNTIIFTLRLIKKLPNQSIQDLADLSGVSESKIKQLKQVLLTKDLPKIRKKINALFLVNITLPDTEETKIIKAINSIIKVK